MVHKRIFTGTSLLIFVSYLSMSLSGPQGRACYHAKICVHNAVEKCGIDSKGNLRRFFDSCDIKEYNCLKRTDFVKTTLDKCDSLSPLKVHKKPEKAEYEPKVDTDEKSKVNDEAKNIETNLNKDKKRLIFFTNKATANQNRKIILKNQSNENVELDSEKANNWQKEDNNNNDVSKSKDTREPNEVTDEKEVYEEKAEPKRSILMNSNPSTADEAESNDDRELNENSKQSADESAIETENDGDDENVNDDLNND